MSETFRCLQDGCDGDTDGLLAALGSNYSVLFEHYDDSPGYGHHMSNALLRAATGELYHVECGGCSCGGSGTWRQVTDVAEAAQYLPDDARRALGVW